ncbi:MAG TPA: hypothetical protein VGN35_13450 [Jatrophihabitantaceae bacterium]|nr:hypothetical protein [Jatrophihabitantaceae bacterium]
MRIPVLTAAAGATWEAELVASLGHGAHPISVSRRCVDVVDLLAVAATGQGQAALVAADLRRFDSDAVDRLWAAEVVPVAVVDRDDVVTTSHVRASGVGYTVPSDAPPEVFSSVVVAAVAEARGTRGARRAFANPLECLGAVGEQRSDRGLPAANRPSAALRRASGPELAAVNGPGQVIAIWGPTGAPGRTTVATGLADEIARLGQGALLVDADVYGGTVAAVLGLLDESPGLAAACRSAVAARLDAAGLAALCWQVRPALRVLTGIPLAHRWPEVRASAIPAVFAAGRSLAPYTVVDCGFALETDEELAFDSLAPRRNGATLAVLDSADLVVAVGSADPIGVQRLIRGLAELRDTGVAAPVRVVLNKARPGVIRGDPGRALEPLLSRLAGRPPDAVLPDDRDALDAATAAGRLLAEVRAASPLRRALVSLAGSVTGIEGVAARHRRAR